MQYRELQTNLKKKSEEDKNLMKDIISSYLEIHSIDKVSEQLNTTPEFVKWVLNNKNWIIQLFNEDILESITVLRKKENQMIKDMEYEQLMTNVLFYMINSLYNYTEICERLFIGDKSILTKMIDNEDYIVKHFGIQMLQKLKDSIKNREFLPKFRKYSGNNLEIVKNPRCRKLIKSDIISVSSYEHELIKKVSLFLENGGDSTKIAMNTEYHLNEFITSLNDIKLKDLLLENVYQELQNLLEIDSILTQNRTKECNELIRNVILVTYQKKGHIESIKDSLGYTEEVIRRILNHPYVPIVCNSLGIDISEDILYNSELVFTDEYEEKEQLILAIADFIIENKASYGQAAKMFNLGKSTVGEYMKDRLPVISKEKSIAVNKVVNIHSTSPTGGISQRVKERALFESEIFLRGYTLNEVAYLVNGSYSAIQRDLSKRLPQISEEKGQLVKTKLQYNQAYKNK